MHQEELSALIEKCRAGDLQARERLVQSTQNQVYFQCLRMLKSDEDAQDAAQDVLIIMLSHLKDLRRLESFRSWLAQITIRTCRKMYNHGIREYQQKQEAEKTLLTSLELQNDQCQPDKILDTEENRRMIVELVDALPEEQRECVLLYYYSELPVRDIAQILEISENTVKSRLFYARRAIKKGVDKYTGQGFKLYGLSPLPFLQYFLQKEAVVTGLGAAAAGLTEAVLAAAGVPAAVGGAAAIGAGLKAVLDALAAKKAAIAAGLLLAGMLGGAAYHSAREVTAEPPVPQTQAVISPAAPEEKPAKPPVPLKPLVLQQEHDPAAVPPDEEPAVRPVGLTTAAPLEAPEKPEPASPPEEPEPVLPPLPDSELLPDLGPLPEVPIDRSDVEEPEPDNWDRQEPVPEPEPVQAPVRWPQSIPEPVYWPAYTPEPEPEPEPEAPVIPVEPEPVNVIHTDVTDFGVNNGYGFTSTFHGIWDGPYMDHIDTYSSSDPSVVYIDEFGRFTTLSPGTAVLTASNSKRPDQIYTATLVVEDHFNWRATIQETSLEEGQSAFFPLSWTFLGFLLAPDLPVSTVIQVIDIDWSSSDETVAVVTGEPSVFGCEVLGVSPGTATFTGDVTLHVYSTDTYKYMHDTVTFEVTVDPAPKPVTIEKELTDFGYNSGYGYTSSFWGEWRDTLPSTLVYESSDPEVVAINETGRFTTLSPGLAVLTATDTATQSQYVLTVQVQNCFQWSYPIVQKEVYVDDLTFYSSNCSRMSNCRPVSGQWASSDTSIAEVFHSDTGAWNFFSVKGISPGTVTITGTITFEVDTMLEAVGTRTMTDTVSFQVTVEE